MKRLLKFTFILSLLLSSTATAFAQSVTLKASGPSAVAVGEMFQVSYTLTIDSKGEPEKFNEPDLSEFNVIAGPTVSSGWSVGIVGKDVSRKVEYTYTYVLQIGEVGTYTLPTASVVVSGKEYKSQEIPIEVIQTNTSGTTQQQSGASATGEIPDDALFMRLIVDKTELYKGEPLRVFLKLYSKVNIAGNSDAKFPEFNGFWSQTLDTRQYQWQRESYNSEIYDTHIISEYLLYPQQAGDLQIDPFEITFIVQVVTHSQPQSVVDAFFGGPDIQEVRKKVVSKPVRIHVKNWPSGAPDGFNGAVGNFTMTTEFPSETITANSSATMNVRITGSGNLPLIQAPKVVIPTSFEQYNIKTTESLSRSINGISGYRQFEYPIIARAQGDYVIDPVRFAFFNPESEKYVSLTSDAIELKVLPDSAENSVPISSGIVSGLSKEDVRILGQDIRYIKEKNPQLTKKDRFLVWSVSYFVSLLVMLGLFAFLFVFLQKRIREMRNTDFIKVKRANKVALQRLQRAQSYMKINNQRKFYEEMLQALWGYMGDKLNIPVAMLTKENVREALQRKAVNHDYINCYIDLISECEYAQYSPAESGQMHDIYRGAVDVISKLEPIMKR